VVLGLAADCSKISVLKTKSIFEVNRYAAIMALKSTTNYQMPAVLGFFGEQNQKGLNIKS